MPLRQGGSTGPLSTRRHHRRVSRSCRKARGDRALYHNLQALLASSNWRNQGSRPSGVAQTSVNVVSRPELHKKANGLSFSSVARALHPADKRWAVPQ